MAVDKLVDSAQLNADLTSVANAIRTKGGTSAQLAFPTGFVSAIANIPSGGSGLTLDQFLNKNQAAANIVLPEATRIQSYFFAGHTELQEISAPNVTVIDESAFDGASSLISIDLPNLTTVNGNYAFRKVNSLATAHFPNLTTASGDGLFYQVLYSSSLAAKLTVVLPRIATLGGRAFRQGKYVAVDLGPSLRTLKSDAFYATTIGTVILRRTESVVAAETRDAVKSIRTLYVPQALVESYATATNWVTDAASRTVLPIEGSVYETQYADGTPIT